MQYLMCVSNGYTAVLHQAIDSYSITELIDGYYAITNTFTLLQSLMNRSDGFIREYFLMNVMIRNFFRITGHLWGNPLWPVGPLQKGPVMPSFDLVCVCVCA